jgi:hypothetical protein
MKLQHHIRPHWRGTNGARYAVRAHLRSFRPRTAPPLPIADGELRIRYESGEGYANIARELGVSPPAVRKRLVELGIAIRGPGRPVGRKNTRRSNPKRDAEIIGLYELGETCAELAEAYGLSKERVAQICRRAGVIRRPGKKEKP